MRSLGFVALPLSLSVLILGCPDQQVTRHNTAPEASINSHESGDVAYEGYVETFRGSASDSDDALSDLVAVWFYGDTEICSGTPDSDGTTECLITIGLEDDQVLLEVRDPEGAAHSDAVTLDVIPTETPDVSIVQPESTGVFYSDQLVTFEGVATDNEDSPEDLLIWWESSLGDDLSDVDASPNSDGEFTGFGYLSEGEHALELFAEDLSAKTGSDSVIIAVGPPNTAPACEITAPEMGAAGTEGELVIFEGLVSDVDVSADWLSVEWSSDKDGSLGPNTPNSSGEVAFAYASLSVATHTMTMTVTDEVGATCTDFILYTVGTPPDLTIDAPVSGDLFHEDESVTFLATVSDNEDLPTAIALEWSSDVDGQLSTQGAGSSGQATFAHTGLSLGAHTLTVTATDSDGLYALELASFTINGLPGEPTVTLSPDPATTEDDLVATATGSVDAEGSTITYAYAWYVGGQISTASTSATLPASATAKDEAWSVVVTPTDSDGGVGATGTASLTISNTAPVLGAVTVTPSSGITSSETLTCSATATDADGETPSISYAWTNNSSGDALGTDSSLVLSPSTVSPGDSVSCAATATDGAGDTDQGSATVVVDNTDPTVDSVSISPDSGVRTQSTLTCSATASDDDGDTPTLSYAWTNDTQATSLGSGDTLTLTATTSAPGDSITCSVTASDADGGSGTDSASVTVENTDPTLDSVSISPSSGVDTATTLTCSGAATDEDGGTPTLSYAWTNDSQGSSLGSSDTLTLSASTSTPGDSITCTATATDADGGTDTDSASVTVENTDPTFSASASISPSSGVDAATTLTCSATASDADGDTPTVTYAWANDTQGTSLGTGSILTLTSSTASSGDEIGCTATATDADGGTATSTDSVTVDNTDPTVDTVSISPSSGVLSSSSLVCSATGSDDDGDTPSLSYAWTNGSTSLGSGDTLTLTASTSSPGDTITCSVTATDSDGGTGTGSASVTVENTGPTVDSVSVSPSSGVKITSTLTCSATASDDDGDTPTLSYAWTNDTDSTSLGTSSSLALSTSIASKGDSISCTATATDSDGGSDSDSDAVSIVNSAPSISSVSVSPASPSASDTLTCTYAGFSDANGDSDQSTYAWTIGGSTVGTSSTLAGVFVAGNVVACAVTPNDGEDTGTADTDSVTIQNTAPEISSVSLSPSTVYTNDTITASASTSDDDGDSVSVSYAWYVEGSQVAETGSSLDGGSYFDKGEDVYVVVTPSDGTDSGTAASSSSITISNTAPGAPDISIDPESPEAGSDDLICLIDTGSSDDDQDTITYSFEWDVDGSTWTGSTYTTYETDDTIDGADTSEGEEWTCTVVASDGVDSSSASASVTIATECGDPLTDIDGNTYSTVGIGSQCWMADNLNTTQDANGVSTTRWCCDCNQYGGMYDWSAVMSGSSSDGAQGICPDGWHVPSDADWFLLESYIDPSMTNPNYTGWSNTTIADQLYLGGPYGFDWLTGGFSYGGNGCSYNYDRIGYWTSTNYSSSDAVSRFFNTAISGINRDYRGKSYGFYVRCLQD